MLLSASLRVRRLAAVVILAGPPSSACLQQDGQGRASEAAGPQAPTPSWTDRVGPLVVRQPAPATRPRAGAEPGAEAVLASSRAEGRPKFVAWLISGQVSRFIYRDSTRYIDGGLRAWSGCPRAVGRGCSMSVDVHIALANTHVKQFRGPGYVLPDYGDGAYEETAIDAHYRSLRTGTKIQQKVAVMKKAFLDSGAHEVRVTIVSGEDFDEKMKTVRAEILAVAQASMDPPMTETDFANFWSNLPGHENRFEQNGNMMYMRHLAYSSAVEAEKHLPYSYTHVLYTREDNVFVHPPYTLLQLARDMDQGAGPGPPPVAVLVDKRCGWLAWSDKLYFASRRGIDILFARTLDKHVAQLAAWINMARTSKVYRDPLMTEEYFKRLLEAAHANVTKFEFRRFEARYVAGSSKPCIPDLYRKCTIVPMFDTCPKKFAGYR